MARRCPPKGPNVPGTGALALLRCGHRRPFPLPSRPPPRDAPAIPGASAFLVPAGLAPPGGAVHLAVAAVVLLVLALLLLLLM